MKQRIFTVESLKERLPYKTEFYFVYASFKDASMLPQISQYDFKLREWHIDSKVIKVTHWLEEQKDVIVFTPQELKEFIYEYNLGELTLDDFLKSKGYE